MFATVKSLTEYGVNKNDWISIFVTNIPEYIFLSLAASYLGARINLIPLYGDETEERLAENLNVSGSELFFVMDALHSDRVKEAVKNSKVKETIVVPALNSSWLKVPLAIVNSLKNPQSLRREKGKYKTWNQFIRSGRNRKLPDEVGFEPNQPAMIVNTSGSTGGFPKGVVYTSETIINKAKSYHASGINLDRGSVFYPVIPNWFSTGASTSIFMPMFYGAELFLDPRFSQEIFVSNLLKYDINYVVGANALWEGFLNRELVDKYYHPTKRNLKVLLYPFQGGEVQNPNIVKNIQKAMEKLGFERTLLNGYGTSENGPGIATQTPDIHTPGSSGIVLPGMNLRVVNEKGNLLKINEAGELQVHNPTSTMLGYFGDNEATDDYYIFDEDGVRWNKVGDYGYVDENGEVYVLGRADDFTFVEGKKIYNFMITSILAADEEIKSVATYTTNHKRGQDAIVHVVLGEESQVLQKTDSEYLENKVRQLQKLIFNEKEDLDWVPENFKFYEAFPTHANTKRNVGKMINDMKGIVTVPKEWLLNV